MPFSNANTTTGTSADEISNIVEPEAAIQAAAISNDFMPFAQINNAQLALVTSINKTIAYLGDTITYQLAVTNKGNVNADNVILTYPIVSGMNYVPGSLVVNAPFSGTPASGIQLTNPIVPGQTIAITYQASVTNMPLPNPIVSKASASYTYTANPDAPDGVTATASSNSVTALVFRYNFTQQINDLIESVALEEAALAAIANAEGAKIQKVVAISGVTTQELLCLNKSVADMLDSISILESILKQKLNTVNCQINGSC